MTIFNYLHDIAEASASNVLSLPFYVFLHQGTVEVKYMAADLDLAHSITAEQAALTEELATGNPDANRVTEINARLAELDEIETFNNSVIYWTCHPHHLEDPSTRQVTRMFKVSEAPTFNWATMDDPNASKAAHAVQAPVVSIVSYAYARYVEDLPPAEWTEEADIGFVNRKQVQTLPQRDLNLPEVYATADPNGVAATSPSDVSTPAYCFYTEEFDTGDGDLDFNEWTAVWRVNPRDGVWFVDYTLGPVPVSPITGEQLVDQAQWDNQQPSTTGP